MFLRTWSEQDHRHFGPGMTSIVAHEKLCALQADSADDDSMTARSTCVWSRISLWLERFAAAWRAEAVDVVGPEIARLVPVGEVTPAPIDELRLTAIAAIRPDLSTR